MARVRQLTVTAVTGLGFLGVLMVLEAGSLTDDSLVVQEQRIEIVIRDSEFLLSQRVGVQLGVPTAVILRNHDIVRHGFTSPMLVGLSVTAESEGMTAYGTGIAGFYVNPGKTLVLRFTPERAGRYGFRCDLHPQMKGEVFLLELGRA